LKERTAIDEMTISRALRRERISAMVARIPRPGKEYNPKVELTEEFVENICTRERRRDEIRMDRKGFRSGRRQNR